MIRPWIGGIAVLALTLALVGCGEDEPNEPATQSEPSTEQSSQGEPEGNIAQPESPEPATGDEVPEAQTGSNSTNESSQAGGEESIEADPDETLGEPAGVSDDNAMPGETTDSEIEAFMEETERRFEEAQREIDRQFEEVEQQDPTAGNVELPESGDTQQ
ncbi:hypothetical protein [Litchfieldella xinjiangensis]|uniref:hypothetical protein n=1 Tax=Litchfieldella xinjiangensis TaxID=1166948 RepID=UPI000694B01E|nr:hypothetical protein [Halomonas xinjiangensis]